MKFSEWLDDRPGRTTETAKFFKVTVSAITQWRKQVPIDRMADVYAYTKGAVTFVEMIPGAVSQARRRSKAEA